MTELINLGRVAEADSLPLAAFVSEHGPVAAAQMVRAGDVPADVEVATHARRQTADGEADIAAGTRHGMRLIVPESDDWPHLAFTALLEAQQHRWLAYSAGDRSVRYGGEPTVPLALWVAGQLPLAWLGARSVAVVGARAATAYGEQCASDFAYRLAQVDVVAVTGGGFGVEAACHRGALAANGPSVLVSAGGLDRPYPSAHRVLFDRVRETGLLVSETPPGAAPAKHRFLARNRIIAALAAATVIIEAAPRSGALKTAAHCRLLGRPLFAVPGPVTSVMSAGCHDLIRRDQAQLVASADDVLATIGPNLRPEVTG